MSSVRFPLMWALVTVGLSAIAAGGAACGGGGDGGTPDGAPQPDAPPVIDAGPPDAAPLCPTCLYSPEPLAPAGADLDAAAQQALAERFNPAQVFTDPTSRSTPVDYVLQEGGPLMQATVTQTGPYWFKIDMATAAMVTPQPNLMTDDWSTLPKTDGAGAPLAYWIDTPGDNTGMDYDQETWSTEFAARAAPYVPTQYAHFFWLSRADGLLAIQYWFFYPWNKFANNHEGDWEHVNIIVQQDAGDWRIVMAHISFHARQAGLLAERLIRVGDMGGGDGDHVVVFTGGDGCINYGDSTWCGRAAGASFPYPGTYPTNAMEVVAGDAARPGRPFHANQFEVVVLPRLDEPVPPNLSWYKLPFMAGQPETLANHPAVIFSNSHRAPRTAGAGHFEFEESIPMPYDVFAQATLLPFVPPAGWTMIANPDPTTF